MEGGNVPPSFTGYVLTMTFRYLRAYAVLTLAASALVIGAVFYSPFGSTAKAQTPAVSPAVQAALKAGLVQTAEKTVEGTLVQQGATVTNLALYQPVTVDAFGFVHVILTVTTLESGTMHVAVVFAKSGYQVVGINRVL